MKSLISLCLCLALCAVGIAKDSPKTITLKPGDQLTIIVQDAAPASLAPVVAAATLEPIPIGFDDVRVEFEQVCVNGVCRWQPVRRALNRTANVLQAAPLRSIMVRGDVCPCGCNMAGCNCAQATIRNFQTVQAAPMLYRESPVQYAVETRQRVRATRTIRAPLQTILQNRRN